MEVLWTLYNFIRNWVLTKLARSNVLDAVGRTLFVRTVALVVRLLVSVDEDVVVRCVVAGGDAALGDLVAVPQRPHAAQILVVHIHHVRAGHIARREQRPCSTRHTSSVKRMSIFLYGLVSLQSTNPLSFGKFWIVTLLSNLEKIRITFLLITKYWQLILLTNQSRFYCNIIWIDTCY